jgi:hemoglobin-like flavoprotein
MSTIALIEQSFSEVTKNKKIFVNTFYSDLFELAPELEFLFKNTTKEKQGEKLFEALVLLVENLETPEVIQEMLKPLGNDHIGYGTQPKHYSIVGQCLVSSIKKLNGDNWNSEMEKAWLDTYGSVAQIMIG